MSQARLRFWFTGAVAKMLSPEQLREACSEFLRLAALDAAGQRVYIPTTRPPKCQQCLELIQDMRTEGKTWNEIGKAVDASRETVRLACKKTVL